MDSTSTSIPHPESLAVHSLDDETGSMPAVMIVAIAFLLLLLATVLLRISGFVAKVDGFESADRAALAIGSSRAEAMNQIVALNHEIGRRLAWAVVGAAVSGRRADRSDLPADSGAASDLLDSTILRLAGELEAIGGATPASIEVSRRLEAGAATGAAKLDLKRLLAGEYARRLEEASLDVPPIEFAILGEWRELDHLEGEALGTVEALDHLIVHAIPRQLGRAAAIAEGWPNDLDAESERLGLELRAVIGIDPESCTLPLRPDPDPMNPQGAGTQLAPSQLVDAAWPWVCFLQGPIHHRLDRLRLSRAGDHYHKWVVNMTKTIAAEVQGLGAPPMLVLLDSGPGLRGQEPWRSDPILAARRFAAVVFVMKRTSRPLTFGPMRDQHPEGRLSHAQVMIHPSRVVDGRPAPWDSLAWESDPPGFPELPRTAPEPIARPSWVARLVPASRLNEVGPTLPAPFLGPVSNVVPAPDALQTH